MKKILSLLSIVFTVFNCTGYTYAKGIKKCYVTASGLNCRVSPGVNSKVITVFPRGTELQVVRSNGVWWEVSNNRVEGWCHSSYLTTSKPTKSSKGKLLGNFKISYYTCSKSENGGWDVTSRGHKLTDVVGECIAVDPKVIPYGTRVYIEGVGYRTAMDCGGSIKGNKIDVLVRSKKDIPKNGVHYSNVYYAN